LKRYRGERWPLPLILFSYPFYGKEESEGDIIKSNAGKGTTWFFVYASIYMILRNKRCTLAIKYIRKGESSKAVEHGVFGQSKSKILKDTIDFLLEEVEQTGFKIKGLYLDRKFFTVEVINYLQEKQTFYHALCFKRKMRRHKKHVCGEEKLLYPVYNTFYGWWSHLPNSYRGEIL